ncbi:MAG: L-fucose/L-arabinose isomerase family protein [Candidatus Helarchaeota archaeon]
MARPTISIIDEMNGISRKVRDFLTFGVIVGNRAFFPDILAKQGRKDIIQTLQEMGHALVILDENEGTFGTVQTHQDARKCADLFKNNREKIDGIIVTLPNFGDEKAIANAIRWANLDVPILIQAEPDTITEMNVGKRRDSFCGKISVCANLTQYGIPFTLTTFHSCSVKSVVFKEDIQDFVAICRIVNGLRGARIGAIGARPAAFNTVRYSEKLLEMAGISVETIDLSEIIGRVETLEAPDQINQRMEYIKSYVTVSDDAPTDKLEKIARLSLILEQWIEEYELDAIAFQCWTAIEEYLGIAPCATLSMLSNKLIPAACEVDVTGALSMLALELASGKAAAILDWNNNYGDDPDKVVVFHCSNLPADILLKPRLDSHFSDSFANKSGFGTISGRIAEGPLTFTRISTDDAAGVINFYAGEGQFTNDDLETFGGYGVIEIPNLQDLLQTICLAGFEHHVAVTRGNVVYAIKEALTKYLDFMIYFQASFTEE